MSYILEALKKAQAERQLGDTPNIHAPPPAYAAPTSASKRKPLLIGLGAGGAIVAAGAVLFMRPPAPAPAPVVQVASAPVAVPAPAPIAAPIAAPMAASVAAPAAVAPEPVAPPPPVEPPRPKAANVKGRAEAPAPAAEPAPRVETMVAAPEAPRPAILAPAPAPTADDGVGPLQSLPEAVQREVPKVAVGGYIYSPNPAERLLLVDKMLRREGEEVAPGLVLERLLPKAAIMNYRGYRYRVGY